MTTAVVDACYAAAWVLPDEMSDKAERVLKQAMEGDLSLVAPDLWHYEMCNLLVTACRRGRMDEEQLQEGAALLSEIPIDLYDHHEPLSRRRILIFAAKYGLSAYDAAYVELADRLQSSLLTADRKIGAAAAQIGLACSCDG
jgi:predicted nucleic acid-binding protein